MKKVINCQIRACVNSFFCITIVMILFCFLEGDSDGNDIFNPISVDLSIDDMKKIEGVSVIDNDFLNNEDSILKVYVVENNFRESRDVVLPSGVTVQVVLKMHSPSCKSTEYIGTDFISCTDKKFNYKGMRIGMPLHEAVGFLVNPLVDFDYNNKKRVFGSNGIELIFGGYFPGEQKKIWRSDIVTEIIQFRIVDRAEQFKRLSMDWEKLYIPKNFSDYLSEEVKKNGANKLFHPIHIGMKRSTVSGLLTLLPGYTVENVFRRFEVLMYEGVLKHKNAKIKVRVGFCDEKFPGRPGDLHDENNQVLYYIETVDKSFVSPSGIRVGMPLGNIIKNKSDIKWEFEGRRKREWFRFYFRNGTTLVVNAIIDGKPFCVTDYNARSRAIIYAIEQNPPSCWENAPNFLNLKK